MCEGCEVQKSLIVEMRLCDSEAFCSTVHLDRQSPVASGTKTAQKSQSSPKTFGLFRHHCERPRKKRQLASRRGTKQWPRRQKVHLCARGLASFPAMSGVPEFSGVRCEERCSHAMLKE